nr:DNA-3-methyladenine glycosylase [uncultured Acetatifactor sp.]
MKLDRNFYIRDGLSVARDLIGKQLVHCTGKGITKGIIVEAEAYIGPEDTASHAYKSLRTDRTQIQYGIGGHAYIYTIYGLHTCMNVVANQKDFPEVVLIRALQPTVGIELMQNRRQKQSVRELCNGPGKLSQAMGITKDCYGLDLCGNELYIETVAGSALSVSTTKRINIDYAGEAVHYLWRFVFSNNKFISVPPRC